jgi:hypothetical protein
MAERENDFHAHLDNCRQCRNNPFELCAVGRALAAAALKELEALAGIPSKDKAK